jgi:uncharacterized membrane protein
MTGLDVSGTRDSAARAARRASDSRWMDWWARFGIAARGVVYGLIGVLALQLAFGNRSKEADQKGAFQTLAQQPGGKAMLWAVAVGLFGYALWQATEAIWGYRAEEGRKRLTKRVESAAKAVAYVLIGTLAVKIVTGLGKASAGGETATAKVLGMSGGQFLVGLAGVITIAIGAVQVWRGLKADFTKYLNLSSLSSRTRSALVRLGKVGYVARGIVFALIGVLVIAAAVTFDPDKARGFDAALRSLAGQPYGQWLLSAIAVGLLCFGAYCFADAKYRRI